MKILLASLALGLVPAFAMAACWEDRTAMSCTDGTVYDADTQTCVPAPTG